MLLFEYCPPHLIVFNLIAVKVPSNWKWFYIPSIDLFW
jgi:hypothetical protein